MKVGSLISIFVGMSDIIIIIIIIIIISIIILCTSSVSVIIDNDNLEMYRWEELGV